ncbi:hypothetical protein ACOMHN_004764 [Nucella lapillus]
MQCRLPEVLAGEETVISVACLVGLKGARGEGVQPPKEVRQWADPREEEHEDEMHEVRRRRLQRFSQEKPENKNSHSDEHSLDLD